MWTPITVTQYRVVNAALTTVTTSLIGRTYFTSSVSSRRQEISGSESKVRKELIFSALNLRADIRRGDLLYPVPGDASGGEYGRVIDYRMYTTSLQCNIQRVAYTEHKVFVPQAMTEQLSGANLNDFGSESQTTALVYLEPLRDDVTIMAFGSTQQRAVQVFSILPLAAKTVISDGVDIFQLQTDSQVWPATLDYRANAVRLPALPNGVSL